PGESLPRWTFALYWRRDGKPIWRNPDLIAVEQGAAAAAIGAAEKVIKAIAERLGVSPEFVVPAYEDPAQWVLKEADLPANVTPADSKLEDPEARARLSRVFERGLGNPSGYVLPIQRWNAAASAADWISQKWPLRRQK